MISTDVAIIGGGPAGTTVGSKLAQHGRKVLLLEREKFPRFHIGESITAFGFTVFKEMGVYDELAAMKRDLDKVRGYLAQASL